MSVESPVTPTPDAGGSGSLPDPTLERRTAAEPAAHGSAVQCVFKDDGETYETAHTRWYDDVGDRDREPAVVAELDVDKFDWLPNPSHDRDYVLVLSSSGWKGGIGSGDDWSQWYQYHIKLRERDADGNLSKGPLSVHVEIIPQRDDLVYEDGGEISLPYGEGTLVRCSTTWADTSDEIETRMLDVLETVYGCDRQELWRAREYRSRRIYKAEAHHRVDIGWKRQLVEVLEQTKSLIAFGGGSEIDAHQTRQKEGWLEAVVDADRWHLLGYPDVPWNIELKVYQAAGWHKIPRSDPAHHPKLEASFAGVDWDAQLPHVDDWDDVMKTLRTVVSSHLEWAGVDRENLIADEFQPGPNAASYSYQHPRERREQLRARYEAISTEIYREALKSNTTAVYDILRTVAVESGATYDMLEERTGLARSTIRYHVRRMSEIGIVDRVGNPVIVVFPSIEVLDNASEILRTIYPDDEQTDMDDRAEERRDRRESHDVDDDQNSDDDRDRDRWEYFGDVDLDPMQLAAALDRDHIGDDDVRVRVGPYDWLG